MIGVFSFNGNKIITTSTGGMLLTDVPEFAARARKLASQAREPVLHYEHKEVGFNYRMSNLLAALGRAQFGQLSQKVACRRDIFSRYQQRLADVEGISFMPEASYGRSTRWLTVALVDSSRFGATRDEVIAALEAANIEARPAWKPMHQQPIFRDCRHIGGEVADTLFEQGLCLPSGSGLTDADVDRVTGVLKKVPLDQVTPQR